MIHDIGLDGNPIVETLTKGVLGQAFVAPPFSVLNAREGAWQSRKRKWLELGIQSEIGRGGNLLSLSDGCEEYRKRAGDYASPGGSPRPAMDYSHRERGDGAGRPIRKHTPSLKGGLVFGLTMSPYEEQHKPQRKKRATQGGPSLDGTEEKGDEEISAANSGTSIFDPVLCELMYRWFCPPTGQVVDPFAGGSVRGVVARVLGRRYWGCDLSKQQVRANRHQAKTILGVEGSTQKDLVWVVGDSSKQVEFAPRADFIFTCPPYGDLEQYSDDPRDLSNMSDEEFLLTYTEIISQACGRLRRDRFAAVVVGDYRNKRGAYMNLPARTIRAFFECGLDYYNECILLTAVGSLPVRTKKQFDNSRKLGRTHQTVLIFVKGDPVKATRAITGEKK